MNITIRRWQRDIKRFEADVFLGDFRRRYVIPLTAYNGLTKTAEIEKACYKYAETKALAAHAVKDAAKPIPASELTVDAFYPEFLKDLVNNSASTQETYNRLYQKHLKAITGKWKLHEISIKHLDNLRSTLLLTTCSKVGRKTRLDKKHKHKDVGVKDKQTLSGKTVNSILTCFVSILTRAWRWGHIKKVPYCKYVPVVHGEASKIDKEKYYDKEQEKALVDAAYALGIMPYVYVLLGLDAGLRVSEMAGLTWDNVDFNRRVLSIKYAVVVKDGKLITKAPKMNKPRIVNMASERLYDALKQSSTMSDNTGTVLKKALLDNSSTRGLWGADEISPATLKYWMSVITAAANKLNSRVKRCSNPHKLRHTCATRIADKTGNVMAVKEQLGHGSVNTSLIYMHNEYSKDINAALKDAYNPMHKKLVVVAVG